MRVYIQEMQWLEKCLPSHQAAHLRRRETELWDFLASSLTAGIDSRTFVPVDPFLTGMALMGMIAWMPPAPGGLREDRRPGDRGVRGPGARRTPATRSRAGRALNR